MGKPVKRQKLDHTPSSEDDDATFESFTSEEAAQDLHEVGAVSSNDDSEDALLEDDTEEDDEEEDHDTVVAARKQAPLEARERNKQGKGAHSSAKPKTANDQTVIHLGTNGMFTAQVEEMLQHIRPKHTAREVEAEAALHAIKSTIDATPTRTPLLVGDAQRALAKDKIVIPFPEPAPAADSNLKFAFSKPSIINIVGSYPMKTASRTRKFLYIDMLVQMPAPLFQEKDYLDYRYFYKRAFYLACIAAELQARHGNNFDIRFQYHHDDTLRPVITIRPLVESVTGVTNKPARKWQINILPAIAHDLFPAMKLAPDKNCIRKGRNDTSTTPVYNSSIRADMLVSAYLKLLHKASVTCEAYKDACALGSTWLKQRGLRATTRKGGMASFEWSALVALLLTGGGPGGRAVISERWSCTQIFKATLQLLGTRDIIKLPLVIGSGVDLRSTALGIPLIWDATRGHNLFHKVSPWSLKRIQTEAKITLAMLGDHNFNGFESTFIMKKDVDMLDNDVVVNLRMPDLGVFSGHTSAALHNKLYAVLSRGLTDRVKSIQITAVRSKPWGLNVLCTSAQADNHIKIGLLLNPDAVGRTVDHGPSVEDKKSASDFRKFWGDKAELRRFKDGSISEALVWESTSSQTTVLQQILHYLLRRHFDIEDDNDITTNIDLQAQIMGSHVPANAPLSGFEAFKSLESDIRSLEGLPLPIRQIVPAQKDYGNTHIRNKSIATTPRAVVLQFESSGRWPDDLVAIQRTKIAFLLKLSHLLQDTDLALSSRVGLENQEHDVLNQGFLEVTYESGAAYQVRIYHDREQTLLERRLKDKTLDSKTAEVAAMALAAYKREFLRRPAHVQAMSQLCSRHPALTGTIDVLQKWFASHVLLNHFPCEVIELLAARTFVQPWPWQMPTSVQTGFLRTIAWLARWDWRYEPIIVDMGASKELKGDAVAAIRTRFEAWRKLDPSFNRVAIFAASNVDPEGTTYTTDAPSKVVVSRLVTLARAALQEIETQGPKLDARNLFSSSLLDYSFVIHLNSNAVGRRSAKNAKVYKNLELNAASDPSVIGYAPTSDFLQELEAIYGSAILFFSGAPQKLAIGGVWTPQTAERPWKVNLAYSTMPTASKNGQIAAQINRSAILAEIARLGGDLIDRIEVPKSAQLAK